jgi:hypothetical protein
MRQRFRRKIKLPVTIWINPFQPEFFLLLPSGKYSCHENCCRIWGPFSEDPAIVVSVQTIIMMTQCKVAQQLITRQQLFFQEAFPDSFVNYMCEWFQPWIRLIETGRIHNIGYMTFITINVQKQNHFIGSHSPALLILQADS